MPRKRDKNGRNTKQQHPTTRPLVEVGLPPFELTTPIVGKPTLEELEEKQRSGKRLTLVQTLLAYEVKRKQKKKEHLLQENKER